MTVKCVTSFYSCKLSADADDVFTCYFKLIATCRWQGCTWAEACCDNCTVCGNHLEHWWLWWTECVDVDCQLSYCVRLLLHFICYSYIVYFLTRCMHCIQRGLAKRKLSVCLSVRPSVRRIDCDKTNETCVHILIPCERSFIPVLWQEEWLVRGDPFYLKFSVKLTLLEQEGRFSMDIRS